MGLRCPDGCFCRHNWGRCDCIVCTSKREIMIEKGDSLWIDHVLEGLETPDTAQKTLPEVVG